MEVRILGALEAHEQGEAVDLGVRRTRLCFALLALSPRAPVSTGRLADVLWPEGPPARWPNALQSHISRLRKALDPGGSPRSRSARIETIGDSYVLHVDDGELDARRFELAATAGRTALSSGDHARAATLLRTALAEWRGPMLADLRDGTDGSAEVTRLEELRVVAAEEHADARIALGEHAGVVADLEVLVREHPLRERAWELLLLALYRSGRQSDALRRFQDVRAILVGELGIEPGPGLRELEGAILRQEAALTVKRAVGTPIEAGAVRVTLPAWLEPPGDAFVGRSAESAAVTDAFARAQGSAARLVVIEGEPGIGKTRLVREACGDLASRHAVVLGGRCVEDPLHVLQPFAEAIGRLAASIDTEELARRRPEDVGVLSGLVPELAPHAAPLAAFDADAHRFLLFRAVSNLLDARLIGRRIVVVLDDLQWAPSPAVQLVRHLLHEDEDGGLLIIATVRDSEPNADVVALCADLQRERRVDRIALRGLNPDDVARLVAARGGGPRADDVFARTEGNPFYVEELVRHVKESGGTLTSDLVPESVRDTIARRMLRLPDESRRLLGIAAVCGTDFQLAVLGRASGTDVDAVDDALVPAVDSGVVREHLTDVGSYSFTHALMQTVLRDGLGTARRARIHRRIGEALIEFSGDETEIARHLLGAAADGSDCVPGVDAALRAAAHAVERYTYDDAIAVLQSARATLAAATADESRLQCKVAITLAAALRSAGSYDERGPVLEEAWSAATALDDPELAADVILEGCSGAIYPPEPWPARLEVIRARLPESAQARIVLTAIQADVLSAMPGDDGRALAEWSLARLDLLSPIDRQRVLTHTLAVLSASSPIERVVEYARASCDAARAAGTATELAEALSMLRRTYLAAGDLVRSEEIALEYEELVRAIRIPRFMAGVVQRRAMRALLAGRFTEAEALANEAIALQPTEEFLEGLAVQLFAIRFEQGRLGEVRPAVETWAATYERPAWQIGYAALLAESGEHAAALDVLTPFLDVGLAGVIPHDDLFFLCIAAAANTVAECGDPTHASTLYELLAPHASRVIVTAEGALCWGSVQRFLGPLAALQREMDRAAVHFEAAMAVHERLGARPFLARDRLAYARMLRAADADGVRVETLERTGHALARELGMRRFDVA
jgi:DNA-binding SARP family transcriptional activator/tetratricopeptide (TPR) repeat protein